MHMQVRELKESEAKALEKVWEALKVIRREPALLQQAAALETWLASTLDGVTHKVFFGQSLLDYLNMYPAMPFALSCVHVWNGEHVSANR
ncbi:MAG: hypothetical protein WC054_00135 [Candidatus Nanopelagicales bacterium]